MVIVIYHEYRGEKVNRDRIVNEAIVCGLALLTKEPMSTGVPKHSTM